MSEYAESGLRPLPQEMIDIWFVPWDPADRLASPYRVLERYDTGGARLRTRRLASGRPVVTGMNDLAISVSHSGQVAAVAVGRRCQIGVDIECLRPLDQVERLARRFLSPDEAAAVLALPAPRVLRGFFQTWVRKEAYLKGLGGGVPSKLRAFAVSGGFDEAPKILWTHLEGPGAASAWSIADLDAPSGYVAALAIDGETRPVQIRLADPETV